MASLRELAEAARAEANDLLARAHAAHGEADKLEEQASLEEAGAPDGEPVVESEEAPSE